MVPWWLVPVCLIAGSFFGVIAFLFVTGKSYPDDDEKE